MAKGMVIVTGASRGIGRGIAIQLASHGYDIVGVATRLDPTQKQRGLYEVKERVESFGQRFLPIAGDIAYLGDHARVLKEALAAFGSVEILVNNAGVAPLERLDILQASPASFDRVIGINLRGPFFFTQAVANQMIRQVQAGAVYKPKIIFITSVSSHTASPDRAEYCISKAGLSMAAQTLAVRLTEYGINVYDVRPGIIATDMTEKVKDKYGRLIEEGLVPQKRWGTPEDVGKVCVALAEGYLDYATGAVVQVDGGMSLRRL